MLIPIEAEPHVRWQEFEYEDPASSGPLYPEHYPTSFFQKTLLAIGSGVISLANVYRAGTFDVKIDDNRIINIYNNLHTYIYI